MYGTQGGKEEFGVPEDSRLGSFLSFLSWTQRETPGGEREGTGGEESIEEGETSVPLELDGEEREGEVEE